MTVLPTVRHQLIEAAEARARRPRALRLASALALRPNAGGVFAVAMAAVAVVVAVAALVLVGRDGHAGQRTGSAAGPESARQQLIDSFAILRRPQTKAEAASAVTAKARLEKLLGIPALSGVPKALALKKLAAAEGFPQLDGSLVRSVAIPEWHATLIIAPEVVHRSPAVTSAYEGVTALLLTAPAGHLQTPLGLAGTGVQRAPNAARVRAQGLSVFATAPPHGTRVALIVPDGVARVTLGSVTLAKEPWAQHVRPVPGASAAVHDNVAAMELPGTTGVSPKLSKGVIIVPGTTTATWYNGAGHVMRRFTMHPNVDVTVRLSLVKWPAGKPPAAAVKRKLACAAHPKKCQRLSGPPA